jgi:hypothetical protein
LLDSAIAQRRPVDAALHVVGMGELEDRTPHHLLAVAAQQRAQGGVGPDHAQIAGEHLRPDARLLEDPLGPLPHTEATIDPCPQRD